MQTGSNVKTGSVSSIWATAIQLSASQAFTSWVYIKAYSTNTSLVFTWPSTITAGTADATDGFALSAGEWVFIEITDPSKIFVISNGTWQKVSFKFIY